MPGESSRGDGGSPREFDSRKKGPFWGVPPFYASRWRHVVDSERLRRVSGGAFRVYFFHAYFTVSVAALEYVVPCALVTAQRNCMPLRPVVAGTVIVAVFSPPYALFVTLSQVLLLLL